MESEPKSKFLFGATRAGRKPNPLQTRPACPICKQAARLAEDGTVKNHRDGFDRCEGGGLEPVLMSFSRPIRKTSEKWLSEQ